MPLRPGIFPRPFPPSHGTSHGAQQRNPPTRPNASPTNWNLGLDVPCVRLSHFSGESFAVLILTLAISQENGIK